MKKTALFFIVTLLCMGLTLPALGGQSSTQSTKPKKQPAKQAVPQAPDAVMHPSSTADQQPPTPTAPVQMRKEIIKVNYIEAQEAFQILIAYKSNRGRIQMQRNRNILIIEDTPEFVEKLLSILKELDVRPLDLMFTVDVIMGSMEEQGGEKIPGSDKLLKELKSLLKYKHFARLDTTMIKVQDSGRTSQRMGGQGIGLLLELYPRHVRDGGQDGFQVELSLRQTTRQFSRQDADGKLQHLGTPLEKSMSLLETSLMLKDGERSVVGVSKLNGGDTALILVIEGRVVR
jgi:type II secretory pathway component GspD/PulD (secretin)